MTTAIVVDDVAGQLLPRDDAVDPPASGDYDIRDSALDLKHFRTLPEQREVFLKRLQW